MKHIKTLSHAMKNKNSLVAFATAWGPRHGGLNAFNHDLLIAVATAHWSWLRVICIVAECTEDEIRSAREQFQVELIDLNLPDGKMGIEHAALAWEKLKAVDFTVDANTTVWLGHDRITGAIANQSATTYGGRSALIHHMSYAHYESFAENSATAKAKETEQKNLFMAANIRLAVGPLLRDALADFLDFQSTQIPMLVPGLAEIIPRQNHNSFIAFASGRLDAGARKIKQAHLGVAGFAYAVQRCDADPGLPDALRGEREPKLVLRGIELETKGSPEIPGAEAELKEFAQQHAQRVINLQALPFTQDRAELFEDLRGASVCLMPSWHEGFGLVAWEAIAAGVPLVLSKKSGAYQLLKELGQDHLVHSIDVRGHNQTPFFSEKDRDELANLLIQIAKDHPAKRTSAHRLREALLQSFHWRACVDGFITSLNWQAPELPAVVLPTPRVDEVEAAATKNELGHWLNLPTPIWRQHSGLSPSQLLKAEEALVPFAPERLPFLQTQLDWATASTQSICIRLLTGEGGTGKTRLALEMCKRLTGEGWRTGFLKGDIQPKFAQGFVKTLIQNQDPVLLVLDYAETRTAVLLDLLATLIDQPKLPPIRVLLLARSSGEWWGQLPTYDSRCESLLDGSATTGPYALPPLYEDLFEREHAFKGALIAFAPALDVAPPRIRPDLRAEQYRRPLYLQMAALLALLGENTSTAEALPQSLVRHEQRYWLKATVHPSQPGQETGSDPDANLLMSLVTLIGHAPTVKALEPLWARAARQPQHLRLLFNSLSPLYPGQQGLSGLQPDLLGESLVGRQVLGADGAALLDMVLGPSAGSPQRRHALTVLARLLRYRSDLMAPLEQALTQHFSRCAQDLFQVCIQTPSPLSLVAERSFKNLRPAVALQVAGLLEPSFKYEVLPLAEFELLVRETLNLQALNRCQKTRPTSGDWGRLAVTYQNLGIAHGQLGHDMKERTFSKQALDIHERLAKENSARFGPNWATSLSNYANCLSKAGDAMQALVFAKQALDIREPLAKDNPERFEPDWASALGNYATFLSDTGDSSQALVCAKQALDIRERLAKKKPERFEPDWATSLGNYANHLSDAGDIAQALVCAKQALDIRERLAKDKPERFEPEWARSLGNYANHLSDTGDTAQALVCAKQALDIRERLAKDKPERFGPDWATSLGNCAYILADTEDTAQVLLFTKKALNIREQLANKDNPLKLLPSVDESRLVVIFWQWLAGNDALKPPASDLPNTDVPYAMRPIHFYQHVLLALAIEQTKEVSPALKTVWSLWSGLSTAQQRRWEEVFLLACAFADANSCLPQNLCAWRDRLDALRARRNGNLPRWMHLVAERKGFTLEMST